MEMDNVRINLNEEEQDQLNMIMHEIYSSLNSITSSLQDISKKDLSIKEHQVAVHESILNISQYADTIKLYLDYWQISNGGSYFNTVAMKLVNIWNTFNHPNEYFKWLMKKKNITYRVEKLDERIPNIEAYPIVHVIFNILMDNAIKYSPADNEIYCLFEVDGDDLSITLENYGPYLSDKEIDEIFLCGNRGKYAEQSGVRGHGYGMNFLKTIVDAHDGDIDIKSEKDFVINNIPYGRFQCRILLPI